MKLVEILANSDIYLNAGVTYLATPDGEIFGNGGFITRLSNIPEDWKTARITKKDVDVFKKSAIKQMTPKANGCGYDQFIAQGWTDWLLSSQGYMIYYVEPKAPPHPFSTEDYPRLDINCRCVFTPVDPYADYENVVKAFNTITGHELNTRECHLLEQMLNMVKK